MFTYILWENKKQFAKYHQLYENASWFKKVKVINTIKII